MYLLKKNYILMPNLTGGTKKGLEWKEEIEDKVVKDRKQQKQMYKQKQN